MRAWKGKRGDGKDRLFRDPARNQARDDGSRTEDAIARRTVRAPCQEGTVRSPHCNNDKVPLLNSADVSLGGQRKKEKNACDEEGREGHPSASRARGS